MAEHEPDARVRAAADESLNSISHRMKVGDLLGQAFMGLSLGSYFAACGIGSGDNLWITRRHQVMAHGEMLMLGAYCTRMVATADGAVFPHGLAPVSGYCTSGRLLLTAAVGMLLERGVIRHLYGRPLETLLATRGISLMLIQLVRYDFGAQNRKSPIRHGFPAAFRFYANLILPTWNRIVVLGFAMLVLFFTQLLLNKTRLGLRVRAVTSKSQYGGPAAALPTGRVDMLTFGLGSGICRTGRRGALATR